MYIKDLWERGEYLKCLGGGQENCVVNNNAKDEKENTLFQQSI